MKVKVTQNVKITFLTITLVLFVVQTSNLACVIAYGKENKFLMSKVKSEGQGHVKGKNNIFGDNFGSFNAQTSNLSHIIAYGKAKLA